VDFGLSERDARTPIFNIKSVMTYLGLLYLQFGTTF
jgi:hypothetical protein